MEDWLQCSQQRRWPALLPSAMFTVPFQCSLSIFNPVGQPQSNWRGMTLGPSQIPLFLWKPEADWRRKAAAPSKCYILHFAAPGWLPSSGGQTSLPEHAQTAIACTFQALVSNPWVFQHLSHGKRTPDLVLSSKTVLTSTEWFCLSEKKASLKKVTAYLLMESCPSPALWVFLLFFSFACYLCTICVVVILLHIMYMFGLLKK